MNVISPPSATDTVLLSLLNMFSDPEGAKKAIAAYNEARIAAEAAIAEAAKQNTANTERSAELDSLASSLGAREAAVAAREKKNASDVQAMANREVQFRDAANARDSAVKQANADAAARDSKLGIREKAVADREAAAEAKMSEAVALKNEHEAALTSLRKIVGVA